MKRIRNSVLIALVIIGFNGCFTAPTYPVVSQIEYASIYYGKATVGQDSIVLEINFKDGDGDLGLDDTYNSDTTFSLQRYYTYKGAPVTYKTKRQNPQLGLPDFVTPYNCTNWDVKSNASFVVIDTLYTKYNPNFYTIFIDFLIKDAQGNFIKFDPAYYFIYPNCSIAGFNGRFPVLSKDPGKKSPLDGKIRYSLRSLNFEAIFGIKTLKLVVTIQDRALNRSNTIETPPFSLQILCK